jgi:site-specific DNA-methyltransferase (adenine-specific)/site-specific DNA-methyltransferase (cytosine-N4-specific)
MTQIQSLKSSLNINKIYNEDCLETMKRMEDDSIDLVVTSPPYADRRKTTYGGIHPDKYVEWFLTISEEIKRVIKPSGSFVVNIKENVVDGERHTYVLELIIAMRKQGWLWTEEYMWHKKNSYPGYWPNRFRDGWERLLHFTKEKKFNMYQDQVKVPVSEGTKKRAQNLSEKDKTRVESSTGSGFGKNISNLVNKEMVLPDNVLHLATETSSKSHSAAYPEKLPEFFIKLFTKPNDLVYDPFMGSGTTAKVAIDLNRNFVGSELSEEYYEVCQKRINQNENSKKFFEWN